MRPTRRPFRRTAATLALTLAAAGLAVAFPTAAYAAPTTYYIDNSAGSNCSNSYSTTSPGTPWCDFSNVNGTTFGAGDSILLARGDAWSTGMVLGGTGTAGAYITVGAYGSGARPAISMGSGLNDICIYAANLDYWRFADLDVSHCVAGIAVNYTSLGHQGLRFDDIYAHDMTNITFGQTSPTPSALPGLHYGTAIYVSSTGTATPTASQWVYRDVRVDGLEATHVDDGFEFSANGFSSAFPSNSARDITVANAYLHDNDACPLVANTSNFELLDSTFSANGSRAQGVGTTGLWFWYSSAFSVINSVLGNTPDTSSPDETAMDIEGYDDSGTIRGSYFGGDAGAGVEVLGLNGRPGDHQTNHSIVDSAFSGNYTGSTGQPGSIRLLNQSGITMSGTAQHNLYAEPNTSFVAAGGTTSWTLADNQAVASPAALANQGAQYGTTQGGNDWRYQQYDGSSWNDLAYDSGNVRWGTASGYITKFESLPTSNSRQWIAHAWTAPAAGTISIRSRVLKADVGGGDGVQVRITRNGSQIWPTSGEPQSLGATDGSGVDATLDGIAVSSGDVIRFEVNDGGSSDNSHDLTSWNPSIALASGAASTVVNDNDPAVSYASVAGGGWTYSPGRGFGDYDNDEHWTTTNGDSVSYACASCSTLGFVTEKTPYSGTYDVRVDGGPATSINTYNATRIARQLAFLKTGLPTGSHSITVTKTSGSYGEVDAFVTADPINDNDPSAGYAAAPGGGWTYSPGRGYGDYRDDEHWTTTTGDSVTVPFYGTGAVVITETEPNGATIDVQLCDATGGSCSPATSVNTYNPARLAQQLVWQNTAPTAPQNQTIKITKTGGTYAQLDAIEVIP